MVSDDSIIKRLNNRDESALQDIQKLYGSICYQMAYRLLESHEDAEECVNDMLMSVWDSIPPHLPMSLQAYLLTLVRRSAIDKLKHENRKNQKIPCSPRLSLLAFHDPVPFPLGVVFRFFQLLFCHI